MESVPPSSIGSWDGQWYFYKKWYHWKGWAESEECSQGDGSTRRPPAVPMGKTGSSEFSSQCAFWRFQSICHIYVKFIESDAANRLLSTSQVFEHVSPPFLVRNVCWERFPFAVSAAKGETTIHMLFLGVWWTAKPRPCSSRIWTSQQYRFVKKWGGILQGCFIECYLSCNDLWHVFICVFHMI